MLELDNNNSKIIAYTFRESNIIIFVLFINVLTLKRKNLLLYEQISSL